MTVHYLDIGLQVSEYGGVRQRWLVVESQARKMRPQNSCHQSPIRTSAVVSTRICLLNHIAAERLSCITPTG